MWNLIMDRFFFPLGIFWKARWFNFGGLIFFFEESHANEWVAWGGFLGVLPCMTRWKTETSVFHYPTPWLTLAWFQLWRNIWPLCRREAATEDDVALMWSAEWLAWQRTQICLSAICLNCTLSSKLFNSTIWLTVVFILSFGLHSILHLLFIKFHQYRYCHGIVTISA